MTLLDLPQNPIVDTIVLYVVINNPWGIYRVKARYFDKSWNLTDPNIKFDNTFISYTNAILHIRSMILEEITRLQDEIKIRMKEFVAYGELYLKEIKEI